MSDIGSDTEAQLWMMKEAHKELKAKHPHHPLLKLAKLHKDEGGFDFTRKYAKKCVRSSDDLHIFGYLRYTFALEAAVKGEAIKLLDTDPPCSL